MPTGNITQEEARNLHILTGTVQQEAGKEQKHLPDQNTGNRIKEIRKQFEPGNRKLEMTGKVPGNVSKLREMFSPIKRHRKQLGIVQHLSPLGKIRKNKPGNSPHAKGGAVAHFKKVFENSTAQVRPNLTKSNHLATKEQLDSFVEINGSNPNTELGTNWNEPRETEHEG